jgi:hypothetical protein
VIGEAVASSAVTSIRRDGESNRIAEARHGEDGECNYAGEENRSHNPRNPHPARGNSGRRRMLLDLRIGVRFFNLDPQSGCAVQPPRSVLLQASPHQAA